MSNTRFNIRHGDFIDVEGPPQRFDEITFVPARVLLNGTSFSPVFKLQDCLAGVPALTRSLVHPGEEAPWVLGRLMRLFATPLIPDDERGEKTCFNASFLAVLHRHENLAIPFECSDLYGQSSLIFSTDDPPELEIQSTIAMRFWQLLLADPTNVADYQGRMYHSGDGVWITFGIKNGESFMIEDNP